MYDWKRVSYSDGRDCEPSVKPAPIVNPITALCRMSSNSGSHPCDSGSSTAWAASSAASPKPLTIALVNFRSPLSMEFAARYMSSAVSVPALPF